MKKNMKNIVLNMSVVFMLIFMVGCSGNTESSQKADTTTGSENLKTSDTAAVTDKQSTMTKCAGGTDIQYLIYVSADAAYQSVVVNGGATETLITKEQQCVLVKPSETIAQCIDLSESQYANKYASIVDLTKDPMPSALGLKCTKINYDALVFKIK